MLWIIVIVAYGILVFIYLSLFRGAHILNEREHELTRGRKEK